MTTNATGALDPNDCDRTATDPRRDLGVDGEGYAHHQRGDLIVRVGPDGGLERVTDLSTREAGRGAALDDYVHEFVTEAIGWLDRWQATDRDVFGPRDIQDVSRGDGIRTDGAGIALLDTNAGDEVHHEDNWTECRCGYDAPADYDECPFCGYALAEAPDE
jgi:hypothetical protein